ncbi:MAG: V-type ATP synthase subunit F [Victivallales bacterium]|jgi:V/A-type H+-transporting ATPase subunit F|nr:V-type ATP synthase subunit F [Victivallales bacterium]
MVPFRIISDKDTALGFRFAGVPGEAVTSREEALEAFQRARQDSGLVVLILTEQVADLLEEEVTAHKLKAEKPYIATIEDIWGKHGRRRTLEQLIFEAVGVKILEQK